jgi:hypothetical protein
MAAWTGGCGLAPQTRTRTCALSDSSHSRTGTVCPVARDACTALVTSSDTTSSTLSVSAASPHSHSTKASAGCRLLASAFTTAGCHVTFPVPGPGEYGVMIISRVQAQPDGFGSTVSYLPARAASVTLPSPSAPIQVIGAYTPSRDAGLEKTERKRTWLAAFRAALAARDPAIPAMFLGDLNVLEPDHRPHYPFFVPFEYDFYRALSAEHGFT